MHTSRNSPLIKIFRLGWIYPLTCLLVIVVIFFVNVFQERIYIEITLLFAISIFVLQFPLKKIIVLFPLFIPLRSFLIIDTNAVAIVLMIISYALSRIKNDQPLLKNIPAHKTMVIFLCICTIVLISWNFSVPILNSVGGYFLMFGLIVVISGTISDVKFLRRFMLSISLSIIIPHILGLYAIWKPEFVSNLSLFPAGGIYANHLGLYRFYHKGGEYLLRLKSLFSYPNIYGGYTAAVLPIILYFAIYGRKKLWFWLLMAVSIIAILATNSRGSMLALLSATIFHLLIIDRSSIKRKIGILVLIVVVGYFTLLLSKHISVINPLVRFRSTRTKFIDDSGRLEVYNYTINKVKSHAILGVGPDIISSEVGTHSTYLGLAASLGLPGLAAFSALLLWIFILSIKVIFNPNISEDMRKMAIWLFLSFWVFLTHAFVIHIRVGNEMYAFLISSILGAILACYKIASSGGNDIPGNVP